MGGMTAVLDAPGFLLSGKLLGLVGRVLIGDAPGPDPYCLRGPNRAKIGRRK